MKSYRQLWPALIDFENLLEAHRRARRGSGKTQESEAFSFHLEKELLGLQAELARGQYEPAPYRYFRIYEPKERMISVAPFRDRVLHHALIQVLEPIYEACFYEHSYATRKHKGTHRAIAKAQSWVRGYPCFFKADIEKYFDSIDHSILMKLLARKIKDRKVMNLLESIIANGGSEGKGLPIGNLTSQFLANVYLHPLDLFVKQSLRIRPYLRYMDDYVLFAQEKWILKEGKKQVEGFLAAKLHLQNKPTACYFGHSRNGLSFLGARIFPALIRIKPANLHRATRRMRRKQEAWVKGEISEEIYLRSMNSYWAYLASFDTLSLRRDLLERGY